MTFDTKHGTQRRFTHLVGRFDQVSDSRCRVVRRYTPRSVAEQVLPVLKRDPGRPKPMTEGVLEIVDPDLG